MRIAWSEVCPRRAAAMIVRSARDSSEGSRTSSSTIGIGLGRWTSRCSWLNSTRACATTVRVESRSPWAGRARTSVAGAWATRRRLVQGVVRISFRVTQFLLFCIIEITFYYSTCLCPAIINATFCNPLAAVNDRGGYSVIEKDGWLGKLCHLIAAAKGTQVTIWL